VNACVDFDGVLCLDPTKEENDDGPHYRQFLREALPLMLPTLPIGAIVSSRLEKYRGETEEWLHRHGVRYNELFLLDCASGEERQRLKPHAQFKASVFRSNPFYQVFIESDPGQARQIASLTGKSVICVADMSCITRTTMGQMETKLRKLRRDPRRAIRRRFERLRARLSH
jgi:uncharacterized HAD superfamily protein